MSTILEYKILLLVTYILLLPFVFGGSGCPLRPDIHPCICMDRSIGKNKFETTLICHNLANADSIVFLNATLTKMHVSKFLLYDSFWQSSQDQRIPVNVFSSYRIHELEVVDTMMTHFGCPENYNCGTNVLKRLILINSTIPERAPSCTNNGLKLNIWTNCPGQLDYLEINNVLPPNFTLKPDFFPQEMGELKHLHLPNNGIAKIDRKTFSGIKFPKLNTLDLSGNLLRDVKSVFSSALKLLHLDLSNNSIRSLEFSNLPNLQTLKLANNQINSMLITDWQNTPKSLMHIDLSGNKLKCDCTAKWVNSTFHVNMKLIGTCDAPEEVSNMKLRRASRLLTERCNAEGTILKHKIKTQAKTSNQDT